MASTSRLTLYTRATPVPYGPIALAGYIADVSGTEGVIDVQYAEKASDAAVAVTLESGSASCNTPSAVVRSLAAAFAALGICGHDKAESDIVEKWIGYGEEKLGKTADFKSVGDVADELDRYMTLRSFFVGYRLTAADFAMYGALRSSLIFAGLVKRGAHPHLARWYSFIDTLPSTSAGVAAYQAAQKQKVKTRTTNATFELGLEHAVEGKVVTRLPPEPSGYLHIGHAKAAILNQYFARMYKGTFIVRYDDTNPDKEKEEFQQAIIDDLAMMGVHGDKVSYTSDYFDDIYKLAIQAIKAGKAYADDTLQEKMRAERMDGIPSARRDESIEDSLARFAEMTTGSTEGQRWCLRAKLSADDPNKALRDPVIYRVNILHHHRTGDRWKVYPTYDFACPIVDSLEGVTHALRTNEYRDRNPQYWWMQDALNLRRVHIWDYGRINFVYTLLSKRKLKAMVEDKHLVSGWDDPRFPTVRGVRRRGMTIEALTQYMLIQGPSQAVTSLEWDAIWTTNKKVIDPVAPRFWAVAKKDAVEVTVQQADGTPVPESTMAIPLHKKTLDIGNKTTTYGSTLIMEQADAQSFGTNEEVTLMDWGNAFVAKEASASGSAEPITQLGAKLHLEGDFKKTSKKVHWLAKSPAAPLVDVVLKDYDYLITKKKLEEEDNWTDFINPVSEFIEEAYADSNVASVKKGDIIQFERKGFYICDKGYDGKTSMEFILIPDGRLSSVVLKASVEANQKPKKADAATKAGAGEVGASPAGGMPEFAPKEAQNYTLDSRGLPIPVTTKMYKVEPLAGSYEPVVNTKMHSVPSMTS